MFESDFEEFASFSPLYCLLFITIVGSIVTSPLEPFPTYQNTNQ